MADQSKKFHLFNCDNTYDLKIVEQFLLKVEQKHGFQIVVEPLYFRLQRMTELSETTIPTLDIDYSIFVVHANESRLSINEENAGIGYAKLYRALLQKTGNKVLIVIGGDSYYRDQDEEQRCVISRWAKRKVASQFREEYLDGRESFIFSWDKTHRPIHEEALRHYFDPNKRGYKFEYTPPKSLPEPEEPEVTFPKPLPKPKEPKVTLPARDQFEYTFPTPLPKPKEPEVTLPAKDQRKKPFVVEDDREIREETTGTQHKRDLRSDMGKAGYGAIGPGASGTAAGYSAGTILLATRMYYGEISDKVEDVLLREETWWPSDRQESSLMEDFKSTPVAKVQFISTGNGGVRYEVLPTPGCCERYACGNFCCRCMIACFLGVAHYLGLLWAWCVDRVRR